MNGPSIGGSLAAPSAMDKMMEREGHSVWYLHGLSSSNVGPALAEFLGSGAGLSAAPITRLTTQWQEEAGHPVRIRNGRAPGPTGTKDPVESTADGAGSESERRGSARQTLVCAGNKVHPLPTPHQRPQVVVVGGGFGGLHAVRELKGADVDVTLVDRHIYNTFQPLLYQVATATLNPGDVTWFLRAVRSDQKNVRFVNGAVLAMDHASRTVRLGGGQTLSYDYLVVAAGATTNFFGIPGAGKHALPLYRRSQALALRDRIITALEDAAAGGLHGDMRVVVVGGGATGVETAGALAEMRNNDLPVTYPELDLDRVHVTLIEQAPSILGSFHPKLQEYARRALAKRGVDLRLATAVKEVREDGVVVGDDEEFVPAGLVIWASGIRTHPVVGDWGLPQGRGGRITVDDRLRVDGLDGVFAVGDIAAEEGVRALPQVAPAAIQGGTYVGKQIAAELDGRVDADRPYPQFKYRDKGMLATIGRSSAIAQIAGLPRLRGFPAWAIWIVVHIMYLLGYRNRLATIVNLSAKYAFWRSSHNAIVGETPSTAVREARRQTPFDQR